MNEQVIWYDVADQGTHFLRDFVASVDFFIPPVGYY